MANECVEISLGSVWYDTVDQPHIPVKITNLCSESIIVAIKLQTLDSRIVGKIGPIKVKGKTQCNYEFTVEAPDKYLVTCMWKKESEKEWNLLKPIEVKA